MCSKSQIALEYAYRERRRSASISVFWVHAGNAARFVQSYKRIASEFQIPGRDDLQSDVLQLVRDWLEGKYNCRWLMIVDNVDDRNMFFDTLTDAGKALREYIPQSSRGSILYTTRNRDIGMDLALDRAPITVPSMDAQEAQALLGQRLIAETPETEQLELLEELVYLPMAIAQAAAFMTKRRKSVAEYIKHYRGSESTRIRLLGQRFNYHGREARSLDSVVTTWWISFNYIKTENPRAAELLSIMSFLDRQGIPFSLLIGDEENEFEFQEAMGLLEAFSLVTLDTHRRECNVHGLVTVAVRAWLSEHENKRAAIAAQVLETVSERFPTGLFGSWSTCSIYFPHAEKVLSSSVGVQATSLHARASLLLRMSTFLGEQGKYEASELRAVESMEIFERLYGSEHPETLFAIKIYAVTMTRRGRYQRAVHLHRQVLKSREKVLGIDHPATLESLNVLGNNLQQLGHYKEAEEIHRRELMEKQKFLEEQPEDSGMQEDIIVAMNNVACVLSHQRRFMEAEQLHRQALHKGELLVGRLHPNVLITRGKLARTVGDQNRLDEAEQMYDSLAKDWLQLLGERHPRTLIAQSNLAGVLARQGNDQKADDIYREALRIYQETLGVNDPYTVNVMHNLACSASKRNDQAVVEFKSVLELRKKSIGTTHPHTMLTRRNLAETLRRSGDFEQADKLDDEALDLCNSLGENKESEMLRTLENRANSLRAHKRYEDAEVIRRRELELRQARLASGEDEKGVPGCLDGLAFLLGEQGKYNEAEPIYKQILDHRTRQYGPEHKQTLETLWNLALVYRNQEKFVDAEESYTQLVDIQSKTLGTDHPSTLDSLMVLAWVLQNLQKYPQSEQSYRFSLEACGKVLDPEDPDMLLLESNLALVLKYQDHKSQETTPLLRHVYETRLKNLGPDNHLAEYSRSLLADHLQDLGQKDEAETLYRQQQDTDGVAE